MTRVHSLVIKDFFSGEVISCTNDKHIGKVYTSIEDGLRTLMGAELIVGHNVIKFDLPALQKLYPWFTFDPKRVFDTLVAARVIWSQVVDLDMMKIRAGKTTMPPKLAGGHSLEAWGHRVGNWKGDFSAVKKAEGEALGISKDEIDAWVWATWSKDMQDYCEQDVEVTSLLFNLITGKQYSTQCLTLEHEIAFIMAEVERNGFAFDMKAAEDLYRQLAGIREEMAQELRDIYPPWEVKNGPPFVPKRDNAKLGYKAGVAVQKWKTVVFNPNSRDHIADRLMTINGWKPTEFTATGKPKVDEDVLSALPFPQAQRIAEYMTIQKRLGQIAEGDNGWIGSVQADGRIHGGINPNGAVTGRATHSRPNIAQVPKVGSIYGAECRALFCATAGKTLLLGCDVSGLELRMLGHFMAEFDGGAYADEVVNGDVHTRNQIAAGLPTRDNAKTFIYAFLYGAGDEKIGSIIGKGKAEGSKVKKKFFAEVPALKDLIDKIQLIVGSYRRIKGEPTGPKKDIWRYYKKVKDRWYRKGDRVSPLTGLDGRLLHIRSEHSALNTLLQSAGAIVCKQWIVEFDRLLREAGIRHLVRIVAWVHDELQMEVDLSLITFDSEGKATSVVGNICIQAIVEAGQKLGITVPLTGEYKIGNNWKETH